MTEVEPEPPRHKSHAGRDGIIILVVAGVLAIILWPHIFGGSSLKDQSSAVSAAVNGDCASSGYYEVSEITGKKSVIYDCSIGGFPKCVIYEGGIAHDATAEVRLLFQGDLSSGKPSCLNSLG